MVRVRQPRSRRRTGRPREASPPGGRGHRPRPGRARGLGRGCDARGGRDKSQEGTPAADLDVSGDPVDTARTRPAGCSGGGRRRRAVVHRRPVTARDDQATSVLARERGQVVHAAFELLERSGDVDGRDDDAFAVEGGGSVSGRPAVWSRNDGGDWYRARSRRLSGPRMSEVRAAFDGEMVPESFGGGPRRSCGSVAAHDADNTASGSAGDRVVLPWPTSPTRAGRRVVAASIIDFKMIVVTVARRISTVSTAGVRPAPDVRGRVGDRYGLDSSRISISLIRVDTGRSWRCPSGAERRRSRAWRRIERGFRGPLGRSA